MSYISKYELEALGEPLGDCVTVPKLGGGYFCGGGGGGGPSSSTVTQSTIPEEFYPQLQGLLNAAGSSLFAGYQQTPGGPFTITGPKPFEAYSAARYQGPSGAESVAQLTSGQQQAIGVADWLGRGGIDPATGQPLGGLGLVDLNYGRAQNFAEQAGYGGLSAAQQAAQYGGTGAGFGQTAADLAREQGGYYGAQGAGFGGAAAGLAPEAQRYGASGAQIGEGARQTANQYGGQFGTLGVGYGAGAAGLAPRAAGLGGMYEQMATGPGEYQKYMSPYMQNVVEQQQAGAQRQADIAAQTRKAAAARAGAFGGARQAIENAEANRALQSQLQGIQAQGLQNAYQQAQGNILNRAQLEAQGLGQAGQLYGVGMQGAQTGLQGIDRQLAGAQLGMQGAGMGLQGLQQAGQLYGLGMQGAGMGLQGLQQQLAGQQLGMQGAGMGLQGVQTGLGGYGLAGQMGGQLADITSGRLRDVMGIGQYQFGMGEQQRQLQQQAINQQILNYQMAQELPFQRLGQYSALLRGYVMPGQTTTQYQANAPLGAQLAGLGTAGIGLGQLANVGKRAGGTVKTGDGLDTLALQNALRG